MYILFGIMIVMFVNVLAQLDGGNFCRTDT